MAEVASPSSWRLRVRAPSGLLNKEKAGDVLWMMVIIIITVVNFWVSNRSGDRAGL